MLQLRKRQGLNLNQVRMLKLKNSGIKLRNKNQFKKIKDETEIHSMASTTMIKKTQRARETSQMEVKLAQTNILENIWKL